MLVDENTLAILIIALLIDSIIGDPDWLWKRVRHPVSLFATFVLYFDKLRRPSNTPATDKLFGIVAITALTLISILIGIILAYLLKDSWWGIIISALTASIFVAQKSLFCHVKPVYKALQSNDLEKSREQVSKIVGRDPKHLDKSGVARATIETAAENLSDGIVAPVFWFFLFGLPGLLTYKAINTADSTIGYKNEKYKNFGWATARLDDLVNYIPARLSGLLIAFCAPCVNGSIKTAFKTMIKDASLHNSPNAGWPEASMAGVLGVALAGPRIYSTHKEDGNWINDIGRKEIGSIEIHNALKILVAVCIFQFLILAFVLVLLTLLL